MAVRGRVENPRGATGVYLTTFPVQGNIVENSDGWGDDCQWVFSISGGPFGGPISSLHPALQYESGGGIVDR